MAVNQPPVRVPASVRKLDPELYDLLTRLITVVRQVTGTGGGDSLASVEARVDTNETDISTLNTTTTTNTTNISTNTTNISTNTSSLSTLDSRVDDVEVIVDDLTAHLRNSLSVRKELLEHIEYLEATSDGN